MDSNDFHLGMSAAMAYLRSSRQNSQHPATSNADQQASANIAGFTLTIPKCETCFKTMADLQAGSKLRNCTRCKKKMYCSKECQIKDWANHKKSCSTTMIPQKRKSSNIIALDIPKRAPAVPSCAACLKSEAHLSDPLEPCENCRKIRYCLRNCQVKDWEKHQKSCSSATIPQERRQPQSVTALPTIPTCAACLKTKADIHSPLKLCKRCRRIKYCSKECQNRDWENHRKSCIPITLPQEHIQPQATESTILACRNCFKAEAEFLKDSHECPRCRKAKYCSLECRAEDWKNHKQWCPPIACKGHSQSAFTIQPAPRGECFKKPQSERSTQIHIRTPGSMQECANSAGALKRICAACRRPEIGLPQTYKQCARCRSWYCSPECFTVWESHEESCTPQNCGEPISKKRMMPICTFCEKRTLKARPGVKCGYCEETIYCSKECLVKDWKRHQKLCRAMLLLQQKIAAKETVMQFMLDLMESFIPECATCPSRRASELMWRCIGCKNKVHCCKQCVLDDRRKNKHWEWSLPISSMSSHLTAEVTLTPCGFCLRKPHPPDLWWILSTCKDRLYCSQDCESNDWKQKKWEKCLSTCQQHFGLDSEAQGLVTESGCTATTNISCAQCLEPRPRGEMPYCSRECLKKSLNNRWKSIQPLTAQQHSGPERDWTSVAAVLSSQPRFKKSILTTFLVLSDTYGREKLPYALPKFSDDANAEFKVDVVLHCGDSSNRGTIKDYRNTIKMLAGIKADLKLVIAGDDDLTLDEWYWIKNCKQKTEKNSSLAKELWAGQEAKDANIVFLENGYHEFFLKSGARLRIYASSWTPQRNPEWAFGHGKRTDIYNPLGQGIKASRFMTTSATEISTDREIDILMTHGAPRSRLDQRVDGLHIGCPHLFRALRRTKPALHVFGHVHNGYGAEYIKWKNECDLPDDDELDNGIQEVEKVEINLKRFQRDPEGQEDEEDQEDEGDQDYKEYQPRGLSGAQYASIKRFQNPRFAKPLHNKWDTLLVNAALMPEKSRKLENLPWHVSMELEIPRPEDRPPTKEELAEAKIEEERLRVNQEYESNLEQKKRGIIEKKLEEMKIQEDWLEKIGGKIQGKRIREEEARLRKEKEKALAEHRAFEIKCAEERKREMASRDAWRKQLAEEEAEEKRKEEEEQVKEDRKAAGYWSTII